MSLILEALRKSEAERQRGRAPGLFVEQQALQRNERRRPPGWAIAGPLLLVVLLLGWGWREWSRDEGAIPPPTAATEPATAADPATAIAAVDVDPARPAARIEAPLPDPPPADPTAAPRPAPAIDPTTLPMVPAATSGPVAEVVAATPAAVSAPDPATTDDERQTTDEAPAAPATAEEFLARLADLPADERAALPPLQMSMHVYSDDPARRFVIVDERRLTEGAAPAPGLVVEQIRRDGAVLSFNGRRLLLPRP